MRKSITNNKRKPGSSHTTVGNDPNVVPRARFTMNSAYPVAPRLRCRLRYVETIDIGGIAGFQNYQMNLNSLFDPNRTGAGHQPRGYDQLSALYGRYRVYGTAYKVQGTLDGTTNDSMVAGCSPSNNTGLPTTINDVAEQPWGQSQAYNLTNGFSLTGFLNLAQLNGKTITAYMSDDTTQALTSASPTETLILNVFVQSQTGGNRLTSVTITLEFDAEFSDPVSLSAS